MVLSRGLLELRHKAHDSLVYNKCVNQVCRAFVRHDFSVPSNSKIFLPGRRTTNRNEKIENLKTYTTTQKRTIEIHSLLGHFHQGWL